MKEKTPTKRDCKLASALMLTRHEYWMLVKEGAEKLANFPEEKDALEALIKLASDPDQLDPVRKTALNSINHFNQPEVEKFYEKIIGNNLEDINFANQAKQNLDNYLRRNSK